MATTDQIFELCTQLATEITAIRKELRKVKNKLDDPNGDKAEARRNNPNNGFNRPRVISDKMKEFLGMGPDETISRTEGTRKVFAYIRENNLKHPDNGKIIVPDEKLRDFLGAESDIQISFSNIQKYLSPHYIRAASDPVPEESQVPDAPNLDPADANGDGRVTRSEASDHVASTSATPPSATKKKVVVTKKKPIVRKPTA